MLHLNTVGEIYYPYPKIFYLSFSDHGRRSQVEHDDVIIVDRIHRFIECRCSVHRVPQSPSRRVLGVGAAAVASRLLVDALLAEGGDKVRLGEDVPLTVNAIARRKVAWGRK